MTDWPEASLNAKACFDVAIEAMRERLEKFRCERIGPHRLYHGDMREIVPLVGHVHACVTDPPYHLTSIVKRFSKTSLDGDSDMERRARSSNSGKNGSGADGYARLSRGFMGQQWDGGDISFNPETWKLVYSALLPGAHLVSFAGTRTYDQITNGIRLAGFEIRDMLIWLYGSGFPKSHDVSKGLDRAAGAEREIIGDSQFSARKPNGSAGVNSVGLSASPGAKITAPATEEAKQWAGFGSALKPALEPICLARKPLIGTIAQNVLAHSTGALNIDGCRVDVACNEPNRRDHASIDINGGIWGVGNQETRAPTLQSGRWPANVLHDSSLEVLECFAAEDRPAIRFFYSPKASAEEREEGLEGLDKHEHSSRSLYAELPNLQRKNKENRTQRANHHPTVKPVDLMAWLVRLITPPKGIVLDPFMGSGTTGIAALRQGFRFVGIEQSEEYFEIAVRRIRAAYKKPDLFTSQPKEKPIQEALSFEGAA